MLLGLALTGAVPAGAQTTTEAAAEKPAAAAGQPAAPATPSASTGAPADAGKRWQHLRLPQPRPHPPSPSRRHRRRSTRCSQRCAASSPSRPRGNVERADRAALDDLLCRERGTLPVGRQGRPHAQGAPCHGRDRQGRRLGPLGERLRAAAARRKARRRAAALAAAEIKLGLAVLKYARHARGGRLDPAALSKPPRHEADTARAQGRARCRGRHRHAGRRTCARCIPGTSSSSACARPCSRRVAAAAQRDPPSPPAPTPRRCACRTGPQLKLGSEHPDVALLRRRLGVPASRGARERLRSRAAGCAQDLPGPQQHPDLGPADAAHARRAQCRRAERQAAGQARARGVRGPAADRQHGALALDARGARRDAYLGQHPGVHGPGLQEGAGHPYRQDHRRQAEHADGGVLLDR